MNKDEFNNLTIENQVEYINKCLNTNNSSLTKISKNLGIDRATIRKRFEKNNYIFDKNNHIYIINNTHNIKNMPLTRPTIQKNDGSINLAYLKALESQDVYKRQGIRCINTSNCRCSLEDGTPIVDSINSSISPLIFGCRI